MLSEAPSRKLATIVALDVVGFSARAEADEDAALSAVREVASQVDEAARRAGGRIFSRAGDGFMLEFPNVGAAVEAALRIRGAAGLPLRVGVHVGDVTMAPDGDLLGHGVNVAARLQALAAPGGLVISHGAYEVLRPPLRDRFAPLGRLRLEKMHEAVEVFALKDGPRRGLRLGRIRPPGRWTPALAAAAVMAAVVGAGFWLARPHEGPPRVSVATVSADPAAAAFGASLRAALQDAVGGSGAEPVESGARPVFDRGPELVLSGSIERDGKTDRVRVRLADAPAAGVLWSQVFEGEAASEPELREHVAAVTRNVLDCMVHARRPGSPRIPRAALLKFLEACGQEPDPQNWTSYLTLMEEVARLAPDFAPAQSALASAYLDPPDAARPQDPEKGVRAAAAAAQRALSLDPSDGDPYGVLHDIAMRRGDLAGATRMLQAGLRADPSNWGLYFELANDLLRRGRVRDSIDPYQRATSLNPHNPVLTAMLAWALSSAGADAAARPIIEHARQVWPDNTQVLAEVFLMDAWTGREREALAIADDPHFAQLMSLGPFNTDTSLWRLVVAAHADGSPRRLQQARAQVKRAAAEGRIPDRWVATQMLAYLGDVEGAFESTRHPGFFKPWDGSNWLFRTPMKPMQRDPRFMDLAQGYGLVAYWRSSGAWPDFCADPQLPYDCRKEADRVLASQGR